MYNSVSFLLDFFTSLNYFTLTEVLFPIGWFDFHGFLSIGQFLQKLCFRKPPVLL